jgi:hypothetical protein
MMKSDYSTMRDYMGFDETCTMECPRGLLVKASYGPLTFQHVVVSDSKPRD